MRRLLFLTALCALLCAPAAASAASRWWIKGAGFGHGIGMSQYGAYGFAQHGWNYQQILAHYYNGTEVSLTRSRSVRVLLIASRSKVSFTGATRLGNRGLQPDKTYVAKESRGGLLIRDSKGKRVSRVAGPILVQSSLGYVQLGGTAINGVTSGNYRGGIELRPGASGGVTAVNVVGLDSYVQGVVPGEMSAGWAPEALKAQAVAARTYALSTDAGGAVFDQYPDTRSQVYKGMSGEAASTNAAVRATSDQIVTDNGLTTVTYFFSTSGGKTEDVQNVFYGAIAAPYLQSVSDPYDSISPRHRWRFGPYTRKRIKAKFGSYCKGSFRSLKVLQRGASPRIVRAGVRCSKGTVDATGAQLRSRLGLYDTWFSVLRLDSTGTRHPKALGNLGRLLFPTSVFGRVDPAPRAGSKVVVYHRGAHGRWRRAATGRTAPDGAYNIPVRRNGTYRVHASGVTGPPLTVR